MATYSRTRRKQLLEEVEGYLDLTMVLSNQFPLSNAARDRIANRALTTLQKLEQDAQDSPKALRYKGEALRVMERFEEAIEPLTAAKNSEPENISVLLALGWCYKRLGKIDSAIQALEDALACCPDEAIIHYNLACYWSLENNVPLALVYLAQSFDLDPEYRCTVAEEAEFDSLRYHAEFVAVTSVLV